MTDMNSLAWMMQLKPEMNKLIVHAFRDKFALQYLLAGSGRISSPKAISHEEYQWYLMGKLDRAVAISGECVPDPAAQLGVNGSEFTLPLEERWFGLGDLIKFPSNIIARVTEEPYDNGGSTWYTFQIIDSDPNVYIPYEDALPGVRLACIGNAFEEYSEGGHSKEVGYMKMKNIFTISRHELSITGSAATEMMALEVKTESGATHQFWIYEKAYQNMKRWEAENEYLAWYGRYNQLPDGTFLAQGKNGRPVKTGAGLLQQIEGANTYEYRRLDFNYLQEFMANLQYNQRDAENSKLVMMTGMGGLKEFDRACKEALGANLVMEPGTFLHRNGTKLGYGNYFRNVKGILGTEVTVMYNPMFDNKDLHTKIDPETGLPTESFRMVCLDFSDYDGQAGIELMTKAGDGASRWKQIWATAGGTLPTGPFKQSGNQFIRSHARDGYSIHFLTERSIKVTNPLACGQLVKVF
jgi:hypothetical protein